MAGDRTLTIDDIPLLLPAEEVEVAQASALFADILTKIPVVGVAFGALKTARETRQKIEAHNQLASIVTSFWFFLKDHERRLSELEEKARRGEAEKELRAIAERTPATGSEVPVVVDRNRGVTAFLSLPLKKVRREDVPTDLIRAYADVASDEFDRVDVLNKANRMRRSMGDVADGDHKSIEDSALNKRTARDFWLSAFDQARKIDSRMVASLLLAQSPDAFSAAAKQARDELWEYLTADPR